MSLLFGLQPARVIQAYFGTYTLIYQPVKHVLILDGWFICLGYQNAEEKKKTIEKKFGAWINGYVKMRSVHDFGALNYLLK